MTILSRAVVLFLFFVFSIWTGAFAVEKIDINTAPLEDLVKIVHIGEARALELISLRPFSSLDGLTKIKGIGEARIEDIKKQGLAWISLNQSPKTEPDEPTIGNTRQQTYPSGIVINETLPSPEGPDTEEEWIEIFNQNNFEVDLSDWQITDAAGRAATYTLPAGTKISAQGFLALPRPETKIILNNDGDGLLLIQPNGNILDSVDYEKAPRGQSYNRTENDWLWSSVLTPGSVNVISAPQLSEQKQEEKSEAEPLPESKKDLAAINEQAPKAFNSSPIFLIALGLAIFSGTIVFILKKKVKNTL